MERERAGHVICEVRRHTLSPFPTEGLHHCHALRNPSASVQLRLSALISLLQVYRWKVDPLLPPGAAVSMSTQRKTKRVMSVPVPVCLAALRLHRR